MDAARRLSPDERETWLALASLTIRLPATLDSQLQHDDNLGLVEYLTLAMLATSDGRALPQSALGTLTALPAPRMSRTLARLEAKGLVVRSAVPDDRRAILAELTDAGRAAFDAATPGHLALLRRSIFDRLTPEQVGQLRDIARALTTSQDAPDERGGDAADFSPRPPTR